MKLKNILKSFIPVVVMFFLAFGVVGATSVFQQFQGGTGTSTVMTPGSVIFQDSTSKYTQDNSNLSYDQTSHQLLVGLTGSPSYLDSRVRLNIVGNVNDYSDVAAQNQNPGDSATTDFFTSADNDSSTLVGHYTDFGITSSGWNPTTAGNIKSVSIGSGGTGYSIGDVLTISTGGDGNAQVTVLTVSGGVITSVQLTNNGTGYTTGSGRATTGGAGTGATINVLSLIDFTLWGANDGYLFNSGGNLILSTDTIGKSIKFSAGGLGLTNQIGSFSSSALTVGNTGTLLGKITFAGSTSTGITLQGQAIGSSSVLTLPVTTDTLVGKATTDTFTNKSISGSTNTLSAIANASLVNSTISGVSLGGTLGALSATDGTLTFSGSYTGATARTVAINLSNANIWNAGQTFNDNDLIIQGAGAGSTTLKYANSATTGGNFIFPATSLSQTVAVLGMTQTFTGVTTFSSTSVTVGNATGASTYGLGTGTTTNGVTKAINIGISGASGSTTNVIIGSATSGALGTTTVNSPNFTVVGITTLATSLSGILSTASGVVSAVATTGSGNVVLATSPTLVTPALGTPTALVGTNITGTGAGFTSGSTNALKSASTTVDVSAATAPSTGQVLKATSSTTATWQTPAGVSNYSHTIFTPTTGQTITLTNNQYNIINPAGALLALTVNLPSSPTNNDVVYIKFTQTVTTVTYANGTVVDGITGPAAGGLVVLTYDSGTTSWY